MYPAYIFHLTILGITVFQAVFMLSQWWVVRRKEYVFYIFYIVMCFIYLLFNLERVLNILPFNVPIMLLEYLDQPMICSAFFMYIAFGNVFLNLKETQPKVLIKTHRLQIIFGSFIIIKCLVIPFNIPYVYSSWLFTCVTVVITIMAIPVLFRLLRLKNVLNNFLVLGCVFITLGGVFGTVVARFLPNEGEGSMVIFMGIEIALLFEFLLLNVGLVYKSKIIQQEIIDAQSKLIKGYEENRKLRLDLSEIRHNISSDLHDDIGASLSSINLYSEMAYKIIYDNPKKASDILQEMMHNSQKTLNEMSDVVWAINSKEDEVTSLAARIKNFGSQLLSAKSIDCTYNIHQHSDHLSLNIQAKKNILLIVKEAMNNIAKYSNASTATIDLFIDKDQLKLVIADNGKGFDVNNGRKGNGVINMNNRAKDLMGTCELCSAINTGTTVTCSFPIATISSVEKALE